MTQSISWEKMKLRLLKVQSKNMLLNFHPFSWAYEWFEIFLLGILLLQIKPLAILKRNPFRSCLKYVLTCFKEYFNLSLMTTFNLLKPIQFWNSVLHFMKTRYFTWCQLGLSWRGLAIFFIKWRSFKHCFENNTRSKGKLISKWFMGSSISSKIRTNEFVFTSMRIVFVRFLEEIDDLKKPFRN